MISAPGSLRTRRAPSHHPVGRSCARGRASGNRTRGEFFGGPGRTADSSALSPVARQGCFHPGYDGAQGKVVGLWYFRARYFDAELGRFISRDALEYGSNPYSFYGVPNSTDPSGHWPYFVAAGGAGASSSSLPNFLGLGVDVQIHTGSINIANANGGCTGTYTIVAIKGSLNLIQPVANLFDYDNGGGTAKSISISGGSAYAFGGLGLVDAPFCAEVLQGKSSSFTMMIGGAKAGFLGGGKSPVIADGVIEGGGVYGGFAGTGKVMNSKGLLMRGIQWTTGFDTSLPGAYGVMLRGTITWDDCWDICCEGDTSAPGGYEGDDTPKPGLPESTPVVKPPVNCRWVWCCPGGGQNCPNWMKWDAEVVCN